MQSYEDQLTPDGYEGVRFDQIGEESEEDLDSFDLTEFSQAVIWGTDWTAETIAGQLEKGNIDLNPKFQRRDAWTDKEKSRFIESLILGFPVPPIILAENMGKRNSYIVIDGKQRLLSIRRFYSSLSENQFKKGEYSESEAFVQLKLRGLDILRQIDGLSKDDLAEHYNDYLTNFENQSIRTIVIKNWPNEAFLYTVFLRLNTGSKKLSPQELRQALHPGSFLSFLDDVTTDSITMRKMLNNKGADPRMKDIELALRFYSYKYYAEKYDGNLKSFFDNTCKSLNSEWQKKKPEIEALFVELECAIEFAESVFAPKKAFSRYSAGKCNDRFSRAIYELLTYYLSIKEIRDALDTDDGKEEFRDAFIELNDDPIFSNAVSESTHNMNRVVDRFSKYSDMLSKLSVIKSKKIDIPHFSLFENKIHVIIKAS